MLSDLNFEFEEKIFISFQVAVMQIFGSYVAMDQRKIFKAQIRGNNFFKLF